MRPHREPTRVEKEIFNSPTNKPVIVIHHYGLGGTLKKWSFYWEFPNYFIWVINYLLGNGITLAPGTAAHALRLLENELESPGKVFVKSHLWFFSPSIYLKKTAIIVIWI